MSIWSWISLVVVALAVVIGVLAWQMWSELSPSIRGAFSPPASEEEIKDKWSAQGMTSDEYRRLLESGTRLELSASVMRFTNSEPKPTFERVLSVLGLPDELLGDDRVLEQYGNTEWHDRCIRYRLGRIQTAPGVVPIMDQFMMLQVCFKNGKSTVSFASGLENDDPLANFTDTRLVSLN